MNKTVHAVPSASHPLPVRDTLRGKSLLVTGVTGFVGKVWISQLLHDFEEVGHCFVLIRKSGGNSALQRFNTIAERSPAFRPLREKHGLGLAAFLAKRVTVLEGDCGKPKAGLDAATLKNLKGLDAIVHFAGLTDFDPDPAQSFAINIVGAVEMAEIAVQLDAKLIHCSTCFVAGNNGGFVAEAVTPGVSPTGVIFEPQAELARLEVIASSDSDKSDRIAAARARAIELGWPNIYTFTKAMAEHLLAEHTAKTTIVRPAIVECSVHYPFAGWNEGLNTTGPLVWLLKGFFRHFPAKADNHHDVIPVDAVTRSTTLILAAHLRGEAEAVYALGSSHSNPISIGRAVELTNLAIRQDYGSANASRSERFFKRFFDTVHVDPDAEHMFAPKKMRRGAKGLQRVLDAIEVKDVLPKRAYKLIGKQLEGQKDNASFMLTHADRSFKRLQKLLDMFRPFIFDNDWVFANANVRALDGRLSDADRDVVGWIVDDICWRDYWLNILYPGLNQWCLPIIEGGEVEDDGPMAAPFCLTAAKEAAAPAQNQAVS
ncbi:MAG: nucleoside-diphosphate-sugar epimerase [Myxococcota bacterium]|jgi:nucleoside-diphosphate-sugar epimerase